MQLVQQRPSRLIKERRVALVSDLHDRHITETGFPVRHHGLHNSIKIRTAGYLLGDVSRSYPAIPTSNRT